MNPTQLKEADLRFILSRVPKDLRTIMQEEVLWLGGGLVRARIAGEKPSDIDFFVYSKEDADRIAYRIGRERKNSQVTSTENAITITNHPRLPVQIITRWLYGTAQEILESFDYTIAMAVIWFDQKSKTWHSLCHPDFYADLAAKRLVYTNPQRDEDAGGSLMRMRKFLYRGYNIQAPSMAGIIARVQSEALRRALDQVEGDWAKIGEERLHKIIIGLLREVDPLTLVDDMEAIDEHAVMRSLNLEQEPNSE